MKKDFAEKFIASIIRTVIAIIVIGAGIIVGNIGTHWYEWCPNNEIFIPLIIGIYIFSIFFILYGIYLISPIYIGLAVYVFMQKTIVCEIEDEDEDVLAEMKKKIKSLRRDFLW